ncbi:hypothetical protein AAEJ74_08540 [Limnospira fusiformis PMC 851.14]|uniref:Uncharacterized protein n=1 Tax=Limnospira fusiformis PMC 851.14 TaxID=2219512 RepID=A0ABU9EKK6_LIMFS
MCYTSVFGGDRYFLLPLLRSSVTIGDRLLTITLKLPTVKVLPDCKEMLKRFLLKNVAQT